MKQQLTQLQISSTLSRALGQPGLLEPEDSAAIFYDLDFLEDRFRQVVEAFPAGTLHAVAVKANPLARILEKLARLGAGLEAATCPELFMALEAGLPAGRIVFDSPVKTEADLLYALRAGVSINLDSWEELGMMKGLLGDGPPPCPVGIRINPQVGRGSIADTSVATADSKFGVPLRDENRQIIRAFEDHPWLTGVHLHIGSQGCSLEMMVAGTAAVLELVKKIEARTGRRVSYFDIGGGLPVAYRRDETGPSVKRYARLLEQSCPELFDGRFILITEFGRYVHANAGWVASRVEAVKHLRDEKIAMIHVGADMFLRKCYRADQWHHEISVLAPDGSLKSGRDHVPYRVAGPLCFAGDILGKGIWLPPVARDDYLVIHDAGAYTLSMWSRYNSRQVPKVIGYREDGRHFEILKPRESIRRAAGFWR